MNEEKITLDWIIQTLCKDGINSKKIVRDRLRNAKSNELYDLSYDIHSKAYDKLKEEMKNHVEGQNVYEM
ncbi:MAG: hypothetical protein NC182_01700 [Prevotella sp.]|nr:hypothetical protein [Staphylococcus sp.]MCM1349897.1 hypothetical protein [Prevotella sp.]